MWNQVGLGKITTNKANGGDGIPVELFQILKDDAVKVLHSICQQNWKTQQWPQDWKSSVFIPIPKKGNPKECTNYCTIALISHTTKVMLKVFQARLQQHVNRELPDVQEGFRKGRRTRNRTASICWIIEKVREFQKNIYFYFINYAKAFDCVDHNKLWKHSRYSISIWWLKAAAAAAAAAWSFLPLCNPIVAAHQAHLLMVFSGKSA